MRCRALLAALAATTLAACAAPPAVTPAAPAASAAPGTVALRLLAINDFHGYLKPPPGGFRMPDTADPARTLTVPAGGAETLASAVRELAAGHPHHVFVAAGDLVGASPLMSALFHDEPTVESLSAMGLAFSAVGNHEFDDGADELLRLQRGGCHPVDGCRGPKPFAGAGFQYLAASTVVRKTGRTLLPPYAVRRFDGVPVAFVGLTLKATPQIVTPAGVAGLEFRDEAESVNALVPELQRQGVHAIVVLLHEGGEAGGGRDDCDDLRGAITRIVPRLDRAVSVVVSGHTHRAYVCRLDGRLVTSGDRYGTLVTAIDLELDRASGRVQGAEAHNVVVDPARFAPDAAQTALLAAYERVAAPLAKRIVGTIAASLTREADSAGESTLGRVVADAQLEATRAVGAQAALTNPGGLRSPILKTGDGRVRYEEVFEAQPFGNRLVTLTISGAQLAALLEQQFHGQAPRVLQVSRGLRYEWDASRPAGQRLLPGSLTLEGRRIEPAQRLRITVNSYLADGGDRFSVLRDGEDRVYGLPDADALAQYLAAHPGLQPPRDTRIVRRD
ncbi:bifunctional metallophosphatase/5'-nucleotidase [Rubrivivax gelatinosus]|uniref:bifunctional metallophosphatase/5'-nucleotidase n=1 Tax=Rubrivivax gelatinosus TaxID=28068 RepID=UPI0019088C13|nr:bifunctional metallophosphatase/5'-nucleotidase [Rubrivivax gelatinosus]MBK1613394.1 bifunctional metallophosphatase/5'-nucleotidase [Rubrivivax gelatinosus]